MPNRLQLVDQFIRLQTDGDIDTRHGYGPSAGPHEHGMVQGAATKDVDRFGGHIIPDDFGAFGVNGPGLYDIWKDVVSGPDRRHAFDIDKKTRRFRQPIQKVVQGVAVDSNGLAVAIPARKCPEVFNRPRIEIVRKMLPIEVMALWKPPIRGSRIVQVGPKTVVERVVIQKGRHPPHGWENGIVQQNPAVGFKIGRQHALGQGRSRQQKADPARQAKAETTHHGFQASSRVSRRTAVAAYSGARVSANSKSIRPSMNP